MKKFAVLFVTGFLLISCSTGFSSELKPSIIPEQGEALEGDREQISDPLEKFNRAMFIFNDKLYFYVLKPTANGYKLVVPEPGRISVKRFFTNVAMPARFANCLFQGKSKKAGIELSRFVINTTAGIAGLFDPAKSYCNMKPYDADTDQTLGYYSIDPGFFIVWPFLGPSSLRGTVGLAGDYLLDPATYLINNEWLWVYAGVRAFQVVNETSLSLGDTYEDMKKMSLDPYVAVRNAYFDFRQNRVNKAKE
jgi:phospholipid-binding lipoprotein MlaA